LASSCVRTKGRSSRSEVGSLTGWSGRARIAAYRDLAGPTIRAAENRKIGKRQ
jgi:hypothetical protein